MGGGGNNVNQNWWDIKNFDKVWGGEMKVSSRFGEGQQTFKKGSQMGGIRLEPKKICALCAQTLLYYLFYLQNT